MQTPTIRAVWLDYLRSFLTLLVVAHHAALAYPTFAHVDHTRYIGSTAPVVDRDRWVVLDVFIGFNDAFFMPLMFFISGLFVYRGLNRKGPKNYYLDRLIRLGIPFAVAELVLIPLAYAPSFYLASGSTRFKLFINDYLTNQQWPVGPPWFIWLLLAFDGVAVLLYRNRPTLYWMMGTRLSRLSQYPVRFAFVIYCLVALSFIPLSLWVGQYTWVGNWGPFDFQLNRISFYLLFFLMGICLGAVDWQSYLFTNNKLFGLNWPVWAGLSLVCYGLLMLIADVGAEQVGQGRLSATMGYLRYDLAMVLSCLASVSAVLSLFRQTLNRPNRVWTSLSANAYGIYLVHYGFVTWLQFTLLTINLPAMVKFGLTFLGALSLSWLTSAWVRQNYVVAQVL